MKITAFVILKMAKPAEGYNDEHGILIKNPFRYRGYYYDSETGWYYLNSRYYDPNTKRFINADAPSYLGAGDEINSYNLFAYCGGGPVNGVDESGHFDAYGMAKALILGYRVGNDQLFTW